MRSFFAVWTKNTTCWEILRDFWKFLIKFNRNIEFLTIFGEVVAKNRAFGNNIIFLQQFFPFRGEGIFPPFPPPGNATEYNVFLLIVTPSTILIHLLPPSFYGDPKYLHLFLFIVFPLKIITREQCINFLSFFIHIIPRCLELFSLFSS